MYVYEIENVKVLHTSEPLTNRGVLPSTLLQDILNSSHHLLNVLLQIANKLGLSNKKKSHVRLTTSYVTMVTKSILARGTVLDTKF
jgi:hypothetical protein